MNAEQMRKRLAIALILHLRITEFEASSLATTVMRIFDECGLMAVEKEGMAQIAHYAKVRAEFLMEHLDKLPTETLIPHEVASLFVRPAEIVN